MIRRRSIGFLSDVDDSVHREYAARCEKPISPQTRLRSHALCHMECPLCLNQNISVLRSHWRRATTTSPERTSDVHSNSERRPMSSESLEID